MPTSDRTPTPSGPGPVGRARAARIRARSRELVSRGPVQGEVARRLLVRVQQRTERPRGPDPR